MPKPTAGMSPSMGPAVSSFVPTGPCADDETSSGVAIKTSNRPVVCQICRDTFSKKSALNRHLSTVHKELGGPLFHCISCDKSFSRRDTLQRHISTHNKSGYHDCLGCGKKFRPDFLQSHLRATTNGHCLQAYNSSATNDASMSGAIDVSNQPPSTDELDANGKPGVVPSGDGANSAAVSSNSVETESYLVEIRRERNMIMMPSSAGVSRHTESYLSQLTDRSAPGENNVGGGSFQDPYGPISPPQRHVTGIAFAQLCTEPQRLERACMDFELVYEPIDGIDWSDVFFPDGDFGAQIDGWASPVDGSTH